MHGPVRRALAAHNGGPGLTEAELVAATGQPRAIVRVALADICLVERIATCDAEGRYRLGDPSALLTAAA